MTYVQFLLLLTRDHPVACVITDASPSPGPHVVQVNDPFTHLTGYSSAELVGQNMRVLHGKATQKTALKSLREAVFTVRPARAVLVNYRRGGEPYLGEVAIRPIIGEHGQPTHFFAFVREVMRRRGRPAAHGTRFDPVRPEDARYDNLFSNVASPVEFQFVRA